MRLNDPTVTASAASRKQRKARMIEMSESMEPTVAPGDLDALLAGPEPDYDADPTPPEDDMAADRLLRHYRSKLAELAKWEALAAERQDEIELWIGSVRERIGKQTKNLQARLQMLHASRTAPDGRPPRLISLPAGNLVARKLPDRLDIDPEVFVPWATKEDPGLLSSPPAWKPKPVVAAVEKWLKKRGTNAGPPPGVRVVSGTDSFTVVPLLPDSA